MAVCKVERLAVSNNQHVRGVLSMMTCLLLVMVPVATGNSTSADSTTGTTTAGMDATTALPQSSTSGVTQGEASSATDCILTLQPDEKENVDDKIKEVFQDNAVFIYFKLKFSNLPDIYENSSDVIDPTTWVWAAEGKGELLLSYPFDFEQLSLGTLSLGVVTVKVPVSTPSDDCLQKATDEDKQRILARFISSLVQSANDALNITDQDFYSDKGAMVCLEKQISDDFEFIGVYAIPLCTYYVFQGSTLYECWVGSQDPFDTESTLVKKHGWLGALFALGFLLAIFSPLAASFFIRKQEPIKRNEKQYIALNADLPLGLKYLLCFSCQDYPAIVAVRWFVYVIAFMTIPFIPYIVSYVMSGDAFVHRLDVAYELLLSKSLVIFWYILVNVMFLAIAMLFLGLYLYDDLFVPNSLVVKPADRIYFGFAFEMPKEICVPEKPMSSKTALCTFMYTMMYRTQMAINPSVWSFWFSPIWNFTYGLLGCRKDEESKNRCRLLVTFFVFIVVFPFALILFCFFLLLNSVPLIYMLTWTVAKCLSNNVKAVELFIAFMAMFLSFAVLFIFVAAFVYIAELIGYTFIGFVLNSDFAGPVIVVIITVAGYLITAATQFYDKYCVLLKRTIEAAEQVDKELAKKHDKMASSGAEARPIGETDVDIEPNDPETIELQPVGENQTLHPRPDHRQLVEFENGVPNIPLHLFRLVITKYQPIYLEVASILFQLLIIAIVVAFGLATIIFIDGVSDLPATVEFFATVVVAGVVPLLMLILKSPGKQENDDEVKCRQLEADLEHYAECTPGEETFDKLVL